MATFIYALCDPNSGEPRYVGRTKNIQGRMRAHLRDRAGSTKVEWLRSLSGPPLVELIETVADEDAPHREKWWIRHLRDQGVPLVNGTGGGRPIERYLDDGYGALRLLVESVRGTPREQEYREQIPSKLLRQRL